MFSKYLSFAMCCLLLLPSCQSSKSKNKIKLSDIELLRGDLILCSGKSFGDISFALNCKYSVRETFNLAVSLLHSFEYVEAEKAFVQVLDADPECAMAYWGVAMSIYHAAWFPPSEAELLKASNILEIASPLSKSSKEEAYFGAIKSFYKDWDKIDHKTRAKSYEQSMADMQAKYPDDTEAAILYSLALYSTRDRTSKDYSNERKAGVILEDLFEEQPNHPGIAHYIIHNYDNPVLAHKALGVARKYADIAPGSSHALHMPSHIFTRLGLWDESISSNLNSYDATNCYVQESAIEGHYFEELHAMDYLVYAYLQKGGSEEANVQLQKLQSFKSFNKMNFFAVAYAMAAIPTRVALENKDWEGASALRHQSSEIDWSKYPWQNAILQFGRALGAIHTSDYTDAESRIEELRQLKQELIDMNLSSTTNQIDQIAIQIKSAQAWLMFKRDNQEDGLTLMREVAEMESRTSKHPVTPGDVLPASELLGDMLLEMDKPLEALEVYQMNLKTHPNRFNGVYGVAVAARNIGDHNQAKMYFNELLLLTEGIRSNRTELKEAREYLNEI